MSTNNTTGRRVRASDLPKILPSTSPLREFVDRSVQIYVFALMISGYPKSLKNIAMFFGVTTSALSRMLSNALLANELDIAMDRKTRRIIAAFLNKRGKVTAEIIIDATIIERSSRNAENVGLYHSNGKKVWGHRITNVGLLLDGVFYVPLAALAHHTRRYARSQRLAYLTEGIMVRQWLRDHMGGMIDLLKKGSVMPEDITFLLDAGYDNAMIQKNIRKTGCHFLMMVKNTRSIGGFQIKKYFLRNRCLAWQSVYFNKDVNGKKKRRKFRIRTVERVHLSKVGPVAAVCSEKSRGSANKKTRRFIVTSRLDLSGREILQRYARRWTIETWHKNIKQNYGFGDCSASGFRSVQNHVSLCVMAYMTHLQGLKHFPSLGTSIDDYLQYTVRKQTRVKLRLINGNDRLNDELQAFHSGIFAKAG